MDEEGRTRDSSPGTGCYIVAVSGSGNSEYLIRWTSAAARRMNAPWIALHVHGSMPEIDAAALERNLVLARTLGAEVHSIPDDDVAAAIIRSARVRKATAIVIGKTDDGKAGFRGRRSVMESILRESGDLDIIVLRRESRVPPRRFPALTSIVPLRIRDLVVAAVIVSCITVLGLVGLPLLGYRSVSILYLLAIICLPFLCGRAAVLAGAGLSALAWNYLFIPPRFSFSIASLEDALMFVAFFLAAIVGGVLTSRSRENEAALSLRERRMVLLYGFTRALTAARGLESVASLGETFFLEHLGAGVAIWLRNQSGDGSIARVYGTTAQTDSEAEVRTVRKCIETGEVIDSGGMLYIPMNAPDNPIGVVALEVKDRRTLVGENRELVSSLADGLALAFEREMLASENERHRLEEESARLSRVLLNHVSHELRTPLTTIVGSVSGVLDGAVEDDAITRKELLTESLKAAEKLNALVDDLLSMSRLETGTLRVHPEASSLTELLGIAQSRLPTVPDKRTIAVDDSCREVEIDVDPVLTIQVFLNILRNFIAYTPGGSTLRIRSAKSSTSVEIRFSDDGPGVPERELSSLFDTFFRGSTSGRHQGSGLGLSICRGIVEAHGGRIEAKASESGGLEVIVHLPGKP